MTDTSTYATADTVLARALTLAETDAAAAADRVTVFLAPEDADATGDTREDILAFLASLAA